MALNGVSQTALRRGTANLGFCSKVLAVFWNLRILGNAEARRTKMPLATLWIYWFIEDEIVPQIKSDRKTDF